MVYHYLANDKAGIVLSTSYVFFLLATMMSLCIGTIIPMR